MLVAGGPAMEREATRILDKLGHGSFIFNLGHGVVPQTPPEHVAELVETVRTGSRRNVDMKIAIILFNLGGPDSLEAVQPFLRNLFSDPAIITLPAWLRLPLARFIASPPHAQGARHLRADRRRLADPRPDRGAGARAGRGAGHASMNGAAMSACATGIR